jgi:hypothetical protein
MHQDPEQLRAYAEMMYAFQKWSSIQPPDLKTWDPGNLTHNPEYFEMYASFRTHEWNDYVKARDAYLFMTVSA